MRLIGYTLGLAIPVLVIGYLLRLVSLHELISIISQVDKRWILTFLICSLTMSIGHTWRYSILLGLSGYVVNPVTLYLVVLVRNLGSDLLPARIGTLAYVYLITTRLGIPLSAAASSFGYALVFDFFAVAPLIFIAALLAFSTSMFDPLTLALIGAVMLAILSAITLSIPAIANYTLHCLRWVTARVDAKIPGESFSRQLNRGLVIAEGIEQEILRTSRARVLGRVLSLSLMIRISKYAGLYSLLMSLLTPRGFTFSEVSTAKAFLGMFAAEISASLPISGLGGIGTYQGVWFAAFKVLGFPDELAALTSISHHLLSQAYGYGLGIIAFLALYVFIRRSLQPETKAAAVTSSGAFAVCQLGFISIIATAIFSIHAFAQEKVPSLKFSTLPPGEQQLQRDFLEKHSVIFDSNRSGTFGIYRLVSSSSPPQLLIDSKERHEMYPALSPDRKMMAYASARSPGRYAESDIWLHNLETNQSKLLITNGTFPSFAPDGTAVIFERNRRSIIKISLKDRTTTEIFPGSFQKTFGEFEVVKPQISPLGDRVAFTSDNPTRWFALLADLSSGETISIAHGCQPSFISPDRLVFVKNQGAHGGAGIYAFDDASRKVTLLHDPDHKERKEYFPSLHQDILLFSSGTGDSHERDTFNIFARLDGKIIPLTSDTATNRWPKLEK